MKKPKKEKNIDFEKEFNKLIQREKTINLINFQIFILIKLNKILI